jgi:hypothetical protein
LGISACGRNDLFQEGPEAIHLQASQDEISDRFSGCKPWDLWAKGKAADSEPRVKLAGDSLPQDLVSQATQISEDKECCAFKWLDTAFGEEEIMGREQG